MGEYDMFAQNLPGDSAWGNVGDKPKLMDSLMTNNTLLQYLSGVGAAISEGKSPAVAMNAITQQQLGARSKVKMQNNYAAQLSKMLQGTNPDGSTTSKGSSLKMGPDGGMNIYVAPNIVGDNSDSMGLAHHLMGGEKAGPYQPITEEPIAPTEQPTAMPVTASAPLKSREGSTGLSQAERQAGLDAQVGILPGQSTPSVAPVSTNAAAPQLSPEQRMQLQSILAGRQSSSSGNYTQLAQMLLNPQANPISINDADLAGLSSTDVSQALHDSLGVESSRREAISHAAALMTAGDKANQVKSGTLPYPIAVPGVGIVTADQFKELPSETKEYAAYAHMQKQNNSREPIVDFETFKGFGKQTRSQFYEYAIKHPEVWQKVLEEKRAGATSIRLGPEEQAIRHGKGVGIAEVQAPDFMNKVMTQVMKNAELFHNPSKDIREYYKAKAGGDAIKGDAMRKEELFRKEANNQIVQAYANIGIKVKFGKLGNGPVGWYTEDGELIRSAK